MIGEGQPDIRLVPSVVSGDPSDRRSIITAASMPAKKLGIKTAQPVSMALRTFPDLVIVRGDWEWYKECSEGFIGICRRYSPVLQQFSIDECFIDMTSFLDGRDPVETATALKDEIRDTLGFTVNVGVGSNKLLAKMASDFEKPDKVHTLWIEEVPEKMWPLGVRDLLWVGKKTEERLLHNGIRTIGDLASLGMGSLTQLVGQKFALQLHENANGRDDSPVETEVPEAKSISAERTFPQDITDPKALDRALFKVAGIVAHRVRKHGFRGSCVSVFIKYKDFTVMQRQCTLPEPTDVTAVILNEARRMPAESGSGSQGSLTTLSYRCPCSRIRAWNTTANGTAPMTSRQRRTRTRACAPTSANPEFKGSRWNHHPEAGYPVHQVRRVSRFAARFHG